jgi:hypothetical protein
VGTPFDGHIHLTPLITTKWGEHPWGWGADRTATWPVAKGQLPCCGSKITPDSARGLQYPDGKFRCADCARAYCFIVEEFVESMGL